MSKPRSHSNYGSPASQMAALYDAARFSEAAYAYDETSQHDAAASLLRARIYLKKEQSDEAMRLLNSADLARLSSEQESERHMLLGVAYSRSNRFTEADEHFERAAETSPQIDRSGELSYWRGRRYLEEHRPKDALALVERIRLGEEEAAQIRAELLESFAYTHEARYLDAALRLMNLLEAMDGFRGRHLEAEIWALHNLAVLARELNAPKIRRFAKLRVNRQEWTEDFRVNQFQTLKAVAWCHALEGDHFNAFRLLKAAGAATSSPAWQAMALLDRAYLARCLGEELWARSELFEAQEILDSIVWRDSADEERVALILAAELFADVDSGRAASYLSRFFQLRDSLSPQLHFRYDQRLSALAEYANGVVQGRLGNNKSASAALQKAWKIYDEIGFDWRAGRCALRMFELTRNDRWQLRAQEKLRNYSASWLADELRSESLVALPRLTPAQRRVLDLLVAGKTTEQIVKITKRRPYTIQNHVNAVLHAFGAPNRSVLVAEAAKRGLIPKPALAR